MRPAKSPRWRISRASQPWDFAAKRCPAWRRCRGCRWCRARAAAAHAWVLEARDGTYAAPSPASHPPGTSVEVRDLFFNVPARRKFLRSEATEYQHIVRMLERLALSRFAVAFTLVHNGKTVWSLPAAHSAPERLARVAKICGADFADHVIELKHDTKACACRGGWPCRRFRAVNRICSSPFSTAASCATSCWRARRASPIKTCCFTADFPRTCCIWNWIRPRSTSTPIRKNWKSGFAIRGACMISCSAPWNGCWPTPGRAPSPPAARRSIG